MKSGKIMVPELENSKTYLFRYPILGILGKIILLYTRILDFIKMMNQTFVS